MALGLSRMIIMPSRQCSSFVKLARLQENIGSNEEACRNQLPNGQFLLFHKGKPYLDDQRQLKWFSFSQAQTLSPDIADCFVFLRVNPQNDQPLFAVPTDADSIESCAHQDMRVAIFSQQNDENGHILSRAWSLLQWHRKTNFCANCGSKLIRTFTGDHRNCRNCRSVYYPSLSPVGIVLIASTDHSKLLLVRQPMYPKGMYSCIAGFVDVGESLVDCVKREAAEEAGVEVNEVIVKGSQHWPFPTGSLMIGCTALVDPNAEPNIDKKELEDARWFSPQELNQALNFIQNNPKARFANEDFEFFVPPKQAIAHHLIKGWLQEHGHYAKL